MIDRLLSPMIPDDEASAKASVLKVLALATTLMTLGYMFMMAFTPAGWLSGAMAIALGGALIFCLACYWLARRGRIQLAGYLLTIGLFIAICFGLADRNNTILDLTMIPMVYALVILPVGYVFRPWTSFLAATLAAIYIVALLNLAPPPAYMAYSDKLDYWSNMALAFALFFTLAAFAWAFARGTHRALNHAYQKNHQLLKRSQEVAAQQYLREDTGRRVLELAGQLSHLASEQAAGSRQQAAAVAQVSTSVGELEQGAREISKNAQLVDEMANETLGGARQGQEIVVRSSEAIKLINDKAEEGIGLAGVLGEHLQQVSRVATIMSDIASEIQLVGFNATLEAAEAGEVGQRFGVVAAEVKDLAADSLAQAKQVDQTIRDLQEVGKVVVELSSEQMRAVEAGTAIMAQASTANRTVIDAATQMADQAGQIGQTTIQQQQASEQVAGAVREIKTGVDRWVVSSSQIDETVSSLRALAERLA